MIVCHCSVASDRRILELIDIELVANPALTDDDAVLLGVAARCGAGLYCGGCVPAIQALLDCRRGILTEAEGVDFLGEVREVCVELRTRSASSYAALSP